MLTAQDRAIALHDAATAVGDAKRHELATAAGALIAHALSMCPDAHRVYLIDSGEHDHDAHGMIVDEIQCHHRVIASSQPRTAPWPAPSTWAKARNSTPSHTQAISQPTTSHGWSKRYTCAPTPTPSGTASRPQTSHTSTTSNPRPGHPTVAGQRWARWPDAGIEPAPGQARTRATSNRAVQRPSRSRTRTSASGAGRSRPLAGEAETLVSPTAHPRGPSRSRRN